MQVEWVAQAGAGFQGRNWILAADSVARRWVTIKQAKCAHANCDDKASGSSLFRIDHMHAKAPGLVPLPEVKRMTGELVFG